ncbi:hypothetical protein LCGC14_1630900, partial [marine sediment metagenome]
MSEIFVNSGEDSKNFSTPTPRLQGLFLPSMDNPLAVDGLGIVTPWGGGGTARKYTEYGYVPEQNIQLNDLASSLIPAEGGGFSFGLEGPQGLRGFPGQRGLPGIITVLGLNLPTNSNFVAALPHNIDQINALGTAVDKLAYTDSYGEFYSDFVWTERMTTILGDAALKDTCDSQTLFFNFPHATTEKIGQTITPTEAYTLETIKFYAKYRSGDPGTCYVSLQ